jgi:hypothetical protein
MIEARDLIEDETEGQRLTLAPRRQRILRLEAYRAEGIADLVGDAGSEPAQRSFCSASRRSAAARRCAASSRPTASLKAVIRRSRSRSPVGARRGSVSPAVPSVRSMLPSARPQR